MIPIILLIAAIHPYNMTANITHCVNESAGPMLDAYYNLMINSAAGGNNPPYNPFSIGPNANGQLQASINGLLADCFQKSKVLNK